MCGRGEIWLYAGDLKSPVLATCWFESSRPYQNRLVMLTLIPMIASIEGTSSVAVARDLVKDPGLGSIPLQFESVLA